MSVFRACLDALKANLEEALDGMVEPASILVVQPTSDVSSVYPSVAIVADSQRMRFQPSQERVVEFDADEGTAVLEMGQFEGTVELRVAHKTPFERQRLEQRVLEAFFANGEFRGVIIAETAPLHLGGVDTEFTTNACFDLEDATWREEFAFERARFSFIDLRCEVQMLVLRDDVVDVDELLLQLTTDTTPGETPITEEFLVTEEGELEAP